MTVLTVPKTMLYCPKCSTSYEDGTQRFCSTDGRRLLPAPAAAKSGPQSKSVFTNLLSRTRHPDENADRLSGSQFEKPEQPANKGPISRIFEPVEETPVELIKPIPPTKPIPRLIKANEVPASQAKLGDRAVNPTGRLALTWDNTAILLGQTIKGRYYITEQLGEDETSVAYLATDKIIEGKKVVVRVLMDEKDANDHLSKIFAEERVSLSHINHPNIASLIDSGELHEGKDFIISEYIEGESLDKRFQEPGVLNPLRAARIIRQIASALSEAHQNGIMHRNLKPEHIILGVSESGNELVKVTDFAVFDGFDEQSEKNIKYLSPEQLEGRIANYASDIYSLAVIAYQMLTGRVPFNFSTEKELLKAQKEGLKVHPTNLQPELSPLADNILEKALSYKSADRYPKARDFGDAFYNALTVVAPWKKKQEEAEHKKEKSSWFAKTPIVAPLEKEENVVEAIDSDVKKPVEKFVEPEKEQPIAKVSEPEKTFDIISAPKKEDFSDDLLEIETESEKEKPVEKVLEFNKENAAEVVSEKAAPIDEISVDESSNEDKPAVILEKTSSPEIKAPIKADLPKAEDKKELKATKASEELLWEKRSPEPPKEVSTSRVFAFALGILLLGVGAWAIWNYFSKRPTTPVYVPQNTTETASSNSSEQTDSATNTASDKIKAQEQAQSTPMDLEAPPLPRKVVQPPNTEYFQNTRENLKGDLAKNFRGFTFYYPNDWTKNAATTNFVDVARIGATGTPIEQILVNYYESKGTYAADADRFPKLVEQSEIDLKKALDGKYELVSQGETKINGDWKAYEMKFQGEGVSKNGERIILWGKRLWIPAARPGTRSGFVITLIATSLSPEVKSADDVGVKGELASVLETFEPTSMDIGY